jgi:hypothetical protein
MGAGGQRFFTLKGLAPLERRLWRHQLLLGAKVTLAGSLGTLMVALLIVLFCVPTVLPGAAMLP